MPALVHGLWDFGLVSGAIDPDGETYLGSAVFMLVDVVLIVVLLVRRRHIEPPARRSIPP